MLPSVIRSCPSADDDFLPLSEYQSQTPDSFFDSKPVLHFHDKSIKAWVSDSQQDQLFFFSKPPSAPTAPESRALDNNESSMREETNVEVFVSSRKLILFSHNTGTGIEIPYPAVTIHAIKILQSQDDDSCKFAGVYMQLEFSGSGPDDDESFDPIELTLIPYKATSTTDGEAPAFDPLNRQRADALFNQISACSNLNPDPRNEDEEGESDDEFNADHIIFEGDVDGSVEVEGLPGVIQGDSNGGLPPPMPGSSGWITADNVDQYFDKDGNWIGGADGEEEEEGVSGELGDGAGRVRGRDEVEPDGSNGATGTEEAHDTEAKRPRTE